MGGVSSNINMGQVSGDETDAAQVGGSLQQIISELDGAWGRVTTAAHGFEAALSGQAGNSIQEVINEQSVPHNRIRNFLSTNCKDIQVAGTNNAQHQQQVAQQISNYKQHGTPGASGMPGASGTPLNIPS